MRIVPFASLIVASVLLAGCAQVSEGPPDSAPASYKEAFHKGCNWSHMLGGVLPIDAWDIDTEQHDRDAAYREGLNAGMEACGFLPPPGTPSLVPFFDQTPSDTANTEDEEESTPDTVAEPAHELMPDPDLPDAEAVTG